MIFEYFLPGYLLILVFSCASGAKKINSEYILLNSVISSVVIRAAFDLITGEKIQNFPARIILMCVISVASSAIWRAVLSSKIFNWITTRLFNRTFTNSFWEDAINWKSGAQILLHMKNGNIIHGYVKTMQEDCDDPYLALQKFKVLDGEQNILQDSSNVTAPCIVVVKLSDVERFTII